MYIHIQWRESLIIPEDVGSVVSVVQSNFSLCSCVTVFSAGWFCMSSLCWSQQLRGRAGALHQRTELLCVLIPGQDRQSLQNTAVQIEEQRVRVQKEGSRVKGRGTCCRVRVKMERGGRGRTGERRHSQVPGFIKQRRHKCNTLRRAWGWNIMRKKETKTFKSHLLIVNHSWTSTVTKCSEFLYKFIRGQLDGFQSYASGTKCLMVSLVFQSAHLNAWVQPRSC